MIREKWNNNWRISKPGESPLIATMVGSSGKEELLMLPHDAMIHEKRTQETKNQHQTGFYPGGCYTYQKQFMAPLEWKNKTVNVEFEGVYTNARVYVNGDYVGGYPNGYTAFSVCLDDFLNYGQTNEIKVIANNTEENSRWYSGSGIYRDVNLLVGNPIHIKQNGIRILTKEVETDLAVIQVETKIENINRSVHKLTLLTELVDPAGNVAGVDKIPVTLFGKREEHCRQSILVEDPILWDVDTSNLYSCRVSLLEEELPVDEAQEKFGIRTISINAKKGLRVNGKEVKLRGSCIHHDNGIIGAVTLERAEERRCRQLKEAGFNSIRSSHHPISRAMLDACDLVGMLVLDELSDCWTRSKNNNDYAEHFPDYWERDAEAMVAKDFNHPCVIMYISGNEIQEAGSPKGAQLNRIITEKFHQLDDSRPVTVAINGLLSCMDHMGEIISSIMGIPPEQMAETMQEQSEEPASEAGSDAANGAADLMKGPMADAFATHEVVTGLLGEFASVTDVVGYNYLTSRHELEHVLNPNHMVLGTETLPSDIVRLWKIAKDNKHVIGDMTWTGYDYLGEAGSNCFYYDGRHGFMPNWPISLSCMGDIDIIGYRKPISYFREIVYGIRKAPYIGVESPEHFGVVPNKSAWGFKDDIASWTWKGYEGKPVVVNVYSDAAEVELFLNGVSIGRKAAGDETEYLAVFELAYEPGCLEAVGYRNGEPAEKFALETALGEVELAVTADRTTLKANGADLSYLTVKLVDQNGRENLQAVKTVTVQVEGAGTLQGFGSADPATTNSYDNVAWDTYNGHLLAAVRTGTDFGEIRVIFTAQACETKIVTLVVK